MTTLQPIDIHPDDKQTPLKNRYWLASIGGAGMIGYKSRMPIYQEVILRSPVEICAKWQEVSADEFNDSVLDWRYQDGRWQQ